MYIRRLKNRPTAACKGGRQAVIRREPTVIDHVDCGHDHPVGVCPKCHQGHGLKISIPPPSPAAAIPYKVDMVKVAKAVANLTPSPAVRRANPYHDLPPVDQARRRPIKGLSDSCSGFLDPTFLH